MPHNNLLPGVNRRHRKTSSDVSVGLHGNSTVHFLIIDRDPFSTQPNLGPLVCGAVETFGKRAVDIGFDQPTVRRGHGYRSVIQQLRENLVESFPRVGLDFHRGIARIAAPLPDADLQDREGTLHGRNAVENLRQQQAVDDVPGNLDVLDSRTSRFAHTAPEG